MSLSCECDYYPEPGDKVWTPPSDYIELATSRRQRCWSCKVLIDIGATCGKFTRHRIAETEIEERIFDEGGEIPIADKYLCECCTDIWFSLDELGFCNNYPGDNQREVLKEYQDVYGKGEGE